MHCDPPTTDLKRFIRAFKRMAEQDSSSVMQLSTFTSITSVPREETYRDFPVTVRLMAAEKTVHLHSPVDIVAVLDESGSMGQHVRSGTKNRMQLVKEAMEKIIKNRRGAENRLAVVAFNTQVRSKTELVPMTDEGQRQVSEEVDKMEPDDGTKYISALKEAIKILDARDASEKVKEDRPSFIIFLTDGSARFKPEQLGQLEYRIYAFVFTSENETPLAFRHVPKDWISYLIIRDADEMDKITEQLEQVTDRLSSLLALDTRVTLKSADPRVSLSKIVGSGNASYRSEISADKQSSEILVGTVSSGNEREFTVYLNVPEGQGDGPDGSMELLTVGGSYTQSWDQEQAALGESVVAVARPAGSSSSKNKICMELDWIEKRLEYWCKVKKDLVATAAAEWESINSDCPCYFRAAFREVSLGVLNVAMHQDIYTVVQQAIKSRRSGNGVAAAIPDALLPPPTLPFKS